MPIKARGILPPNVTARNVETDPMQLAPPALDCVPIGGIEAMDIDRHIERLMRVKALCGALKPERERRFSAVMARARRDATAADTAARTAARSALGLLSLELCDA